MWTILRIWITFVVKIHIDFIFVFVLKGVVVCRLVEHHVEEPQEEVQGVELQREEPLQEEVVLHPKHQPEEAQPLAQDHQPRLRGWHQQPLSPTNSTHPNLKPTANT